MIIYLSLGIHLNFICMNIPVTSTSNNLSYSTSKYYDYPVYNSAQQSERRIINLDHIEQVQPHANVSVSGVDTACSQFTFHSGASVIVLTDFSTIRSGLNANFGLVDINGVVT